jgi:hypothetical protein
MEGINVDLYSDYQGDDSGLIVVKSLMKTVSY